MEFDSITSRQNAVLRHLSRLARDKKYRKNAGEMVCEGWKMLGEALRSDFAPRTVLVSEDTMLDYEMLQQAHERGARMCKASAELFVIASDVETPQGVLFTCVPPVLRALPNVKNAVLLDGLQDPGNLGTVLRTADAFALDAVILCEGCTDPTTPKAIRATMGAIFRQRMIQMPLKEAIAALHEQQISVYAAALSEDSLQLTEGLLEHAAVIIGSEGHGVSQIALDCADAHIIIPMKGAAESLNAGVAASILIWEMTK